MQQATATQQATPLVVVVDDDRAVREALDSLLRSVGLATRLFGSGAELLADGVRADCLVLDVRLPGVGGLEFQEQLARNGTAPPIVFMTGHGDIPMSVRAMKAGAVDFLAKPFRDQDMLDAVATALERGRQAASAEAALADLRARYQTLTPREREVMFHVVQGLMNKQVAGILGLSEITVKIHRGSMMRKMGVRTLADLVRQAAALGLSAD
jgi:FixJ family two-component response regulator